MNQSRPTITFRYADEASQLDCIKPLWDALQEHHSKATPNLGGMAPQREPADAWRRWRARYESCLRDPDAFLVIAETDALPIGYAFVSLGPGYAGWKTGDRVAKLETLSVLPAHRGSGVGTALLGFVWTRLLEIGVEDLSITVARTNVDSRRFYEQQGFTQGFVVYYGQPRCHPPSRY